MNKRGLYIGLSLLLILFIWVAFFQYKSYQARLDFQTKQLAELAEESALIEKYEQQQMVDRMIRELKDELNRSVERKLSDQRINELAILSHSFVPEGYSYLEPPEQFNFARGQLLLRLLEVDIDSASFAKLLMKVSFAGAELSGQSLMGKNLRNIDLRCSNLRNARLDRSILTGADLRSAILWGAKLPEADLTEAQMHRIDLRWANLDESILNGAVLKGSRLDHARFRQCEMSCAVIHYAHLMSAFFQYANLERANFFGSDISGSDFGQANLTSTDFRVCIAEETIFDGASMWESLLREVSVKEPDWLEKLEASGIIGAKDLNRRYMLKRDRSGRSDYQLLLAPD